MMGPSMARRKDLSLTERVILPTEVGSVLARVRPSRVVICATLTLGDLATMLTTRAKAAVHALVHLGALLVEEQERKNADDNDLEEDQSGHELTANRSWSEQHIQGYRYPSRSSICAVRERASSLRPADLRGFPVILHPNEAGGG